MIPVLHLGKLSCLLTMLFLGLCFSKPAFAASEEHIHVTADLSHRYLYLEGRPKTVYLKVAIKGDQATITDAKRPPMNIALVLDKSGSMDGEKISNLRQAAKMLVDQLNHDDVLSVVTYDNVLNVLVPAHPLDNPEDVKRRIDSIYANGGTALFSGVSKGAEELRKFASDNKINRIILVSDGLANVGPSSPAELGDLGQSLMKEGISVSTIGLGLDYNEDLMTQLAARSDGVHQFVENPETIGKFFSSEFGNASSVVADNVEINVKFPEGVRPVRVMGRETQSELYFNHVTTHLNQIFSSHEIYLLIEAEVNSGFSPENMTHIAETTVSYHDLALKTQINQTVNTSVSSAPDAQYEERMKNPSVMIAVAEQKAVQTQQEAVQLRDEGKVEEARSKLEEMSETLKKAGDLFQSLRLREYADALKRQIESISDDSEWNRNRKDSAAQMYKGRFNVQ